MLRGNILWWEFGVTSIQHLWNSYGLRCWTGLWKPGSVKDAFIKSISTERFRSCNCQKFLWPLVVPRVGSLVHVWARLGRGERENSYPVSPVLWGCLPAESLRWGRKKKGLSVRPSSFQINNKATFQYNFWTCPKTTLRDGEFKKYKKSLPRSLTTRAAAGDLLSVLFWPWNGVRFSLLLCPASSAHRVGPGAQGGRAGPDLQHLVSRRNVGSRVAPGLGFAVVFIPVLLGRMPTVRKWEQEQHGERISKDSGILWEQKNLK